MRVHRVAPQSRAAPPHMLTRSAEAVTAISSCQGLLTCEIVLHTSLAIFWAVCIAEGGAVAACDEALHKQDAQLTPLPAG